MLNSNHPGDRETGPPARPLKTWHYVLLVLPFAGLLFPPMYSRWTPEIFGIPFFYAYQFLWIIVSASLTAFVYRSIYRGVSE